MSNHFPLVSIGIPVKNGEWVIRHTLENILRVRYPSDKLQIVVGDHASTDRTSDIVHSYRDRLNIRIVSVDPGVHPSRSAVRNRILENANGEFVIFIDADVLVSEHFVTEHLRAHRAYPNAYVAGYTFGKAGIGRVNVDESINEQFKCDNISERHQKLISVPLLKDVREYFASVRENNLGQGFSFQNRAMDGWRIFWSCNVSALRYQLMEIGGFDESFTGWGHEDEELAYRYAIRGNALIFAHEAWAYHVAHSADIRRNLSEGRQNIEIFFKKYQNGEIENICGDFQADWTINMVARDLVSRNSNNPYQNIRTRIAEELPRRGRFRLGIFIDNESTAYDLQLTHCFNPFLSLRKIPYEKGGCRFYSLVGTKTAFGDGEIDEALVMVDWLMFAYRPRAISLFAELKRVARRIILMHGIHAQNDMYRYVREDLYRCLHLIGLSSETEKFYL